MNGRSAGAHGCVKSFASADAFCEIDWGTLSRACACAGADHGCETANGPSSLWAHL